MGTSVSLCLHEHLLQLATEPWGLHQATPTGCLPDLSIYVISAMEQSQQFPPCHCVRNTHGNQPVSLWHIYPFAGVLAICSLRRSQSPEFLCVVSAPLQRSRTFVSPCNTWRGSREVIGKDSVLVLWWNCMKSALWST